MSIIHSLMERKRGCGPELVTDMKKIYIFEFIIYVDGLMIQPYQVS